MSDTPISPPIEIFRGDKRGFIIAQSPNGSFVIRWDDGMHEGNVEPDTPAQTWKRSDGSEYMRILVQ